MMRSDKLTCACVRARRWLMLCSFMVLMLWRRDCLAADDLQYWSQGYGKVTPAGDKLNFGIYGEIRMTESASKVFGVFVGPTLGYELSPYLTTAVAAKLLVLGINGRYEQWQRLDVELNPRVTKLAGGRLSIKLRNRVELFRHPADSDPATTIKSATVRARHRLAFELSFRDAGPLRKLYLDNEWFWGQYFRGERIGFTEDRVTPLGLQLELSPFAKLNVYYLIQLTSDRVDNTWSVAHCLGTLLLFQPPRVKPARDER